MVYNVVSQADLELASNAADSDDASRNSSPQADPANAFQRLSLHTENTGGNHMESAAAAGDFTLGRLGSLMRSITDTSYDMVEADDYEVADPSGRSNSLHLAVQVETSARSTHSDSPDPPLHSPSTDHPVPLSHPTPDLQSLQGAYVGNVERLERSAECLSSSSADIGSEIRKMDREQKKRSSSSAANSVAALGGENEFPSSGPTSFPRGTAHAAPNLLSISGSHLAQVSEPEHGHDYNLPDRSPLTLPPFQAPVSDHHELNLEDQFDTIMGGRPIERRLTNASNDTYQQATKLFADFDGVHFVTNGSDQNSIRNVSLTRPPLAIGSESHKEPQSGENMIYYPAPVPMMLNLPPRLSRRPAAEHEKRRTQLLSSIPLENRKSAAWLSGQDQEGKGNRRSKHMADLPPQVRASAFFELPTTSVDIQPKEASAVATLESILDASARAPVTAFTDHPFAGRLGAEVYGGANNKTRSKGLADQKNKQRHRSTLSTKHVTFPAGPRPTSVGLGELEVDAAGVHERTSLRSDASSSEDDDDDSGSSTDEGTGSTDSRSDEEQEESDDDPGYVGPPTTLLAELQLRKQELKQRRRNAANAVGLQSTLLELDTVAQKQSERRRQKRVTLAWEGPYDTQAEDDGDEDVPLAMLYPSKANLPEDARPMGLMEKREMEETEPLSKRRARLRGEAHAGLPGREARASAMNLQRVEPGPVEPESGDEGETLGQRRKRLKAENRTSVAAESEFTAEVLAEISHLKGDGEDDDGENGAQEEETLAQRRARLQLEAKLERGLNPKAHKPRKSMAELSQVRPATGATGSLQPSYEPPPQRNPIDPRVSDNQMPMQAPSQYGPAPPTGYLRQPSYAAPNPYGYQVNHPNTFYSDAVLGMNHLAYAMSGNYPKEPKPVIEPGQREMINRWRQSIK